MAEEYQTVDVWIAQFPSQEALDSYLEETISGEPEDDDLPISQFASDQGESFYDSDFLEAKFQEEAEDIEELLDGMSFSASFVGPVKATFDGSAMPGANVVILSWAQQFESPCSTVGPDYTLNYLGQFPCNPD